MVKEEIAKMVALRNRADGHAMVAPIASALSLGVAKVARYDDTPVTAVALIFTALGFLWAGVSFLIARRLMHRVILAKYSLGGRPRLDDDERLFLEGLRTKARRIESQSAFARFGFVSIAGGLLIAVYGVVSFESWFAGLPVVFLFGALIVGNYRARYRLSETERRLLDTAYPS